MVWLVPMLCVGTRKKVLNMTIREIQVEKELSFDYKKQSLVIIILLFVSITFLATLYDFFYGHMFDFYVDLGVSSISLVLYKYYKKSKNNIVIGSIMFWIIALSAFVFNLQYHFDSNVVYIILTPLIALLILPTGYMVVYIVIYQISVAFLFWYGYHHYPENKFLFSSVGMANYLFSSLYLLAFWLFYHLAIERTFKEMKRLNREKTILLQELHHRVKNNFNLILSMLEMQYVYGDKLCNKEFVDGFRNRVDSIVVAHELLYSNSDLNSIDMREYIYNLCTHIVSAYSNQKDVKLKLNIEPIVLNIDMVIYIGIMINEMITNTLKYALDDKKGIIEVSLILGDKEDFILKYKDSGSKKVDETNDGFGKMVIEMSSKQIGADLEINRSSGLEYVLLIKGKL